MTDDIKTILVQLELARSQRDRALAAMDEAITQRKKTEGLRDQLDVELATVRGELQRVKAESASLLEENEANAWKVSPAMAQSSIDNLSTELQRMTKERDDYRTMLAEQRVAYEQNSSECVKLFHELAALRRDKERLDWLDSKACYSWQFDTDCEKCATKYKHRPLQIRDAIDAATKEAAK